MVQIVQYGILGIVVIGFLSGWLYTKKQVDNIEETWRKKEEAWERERAEYRQALALERQRNEIGITTAHILRDLAREIHREITP